MSISVRVPGKKLTQEEYDKLFAPPNWRDFWKPSFEPPDVDAMIDELVREHNKNRSY